MPSNDDLLQLIADLFRRIDKKIDILIDALAEEESPPQPTEDLEGKALPLLPPLDSDLEGL